MYIYSSEYQRLEQWHDEFIRRDNEQSRGFNKLFIPQNNVYCEVWYCYARFLERSNLLIRLNPVVCKRWAAARLWYRYIIDDCYCIVTTYYKFKYSRICSKKQVSVKENVLMNSWIFRHYNTKQMKLSAMNKTHSFWNISVEETSNRKKNLKI